MRSGSLPSSLDRIMSSMSPCSFSMATKMCSGVSNTPSTKITAGWERPWKQRRQAETLLPAPEGTTRPHLQDGRLVPQLPLVFDGKSGLIDHFDGDQSARLPVSTCGQHEIHSALFKTAGKPKSAPAAAADGHKHTFVDDSKLPRTQNLVCEDLINRADVLQHRRHTHTLENVLTRLGFPAAV